MGNTQIFIQGKLTFILTDSKIIIRTSLGQTFYLEPNAHYWIRRCRLIRTMITLDEIRDLNELSAWCGRGVRWVPTHYVLDKQKIVV